MTTPATTKDLVAVIDIGASAIRMVIAELGAKGEFRYLENLQKPVRFGKDVFATGRINLPTMNEAIEILTQFKQVMDGYGLKRVQAVATSAVREAQNSENFIDRVFVRTGIDVEIIEGPEENRLGLIAVEHSLAELPEFQKKNSLIVEVGSGSTEMMILSQGQVEVTRTLSLGSMRLPDATVADPSNPELIQRVLKRSIHDIALYAAKEYNLNDVDMFIALGGDMRFAVRHILETQDTTAPYAIADKKAFTAFVGKVSRMRPDEIVKQFGLPYAQAESLYASLLYYYYFLMETKAESVVVPMVSIRDGLVLELSQILSGYKRTDVSKQILNSARHLGVKYQYDKPHSVLVSALALKIFDQLQKDHGMGTRERMLLEASAILHDIGTYISPNGHHKHSWYLVNEAEIFGLRKTEKAIVANVVRYHRRSGPKPTHEPYMSMPKADRAITSKLAAILRVADALDHGHQQRIKQIEVERESKNYVLWADKEAGDISLERVSLQEKGDMFADVFGLPVTLRQKSSTA